MFSKLKHAGRCFLCYWRKKNYLSSNVQTGKQVLSSHVDSFNLQLVTYGHEGCFPSWNKQVGVSYVSDCMHFIGYSNYAFCNNFQQFPYILSILILIIWGHSSIRWPFFGQFSPSAYFLYISYIHNTLCRNLETPLSPNYAYTIFEWSLLMYG